MVSSRIRKAAGCRRPSCWSCWGWGDVLMCETSQDWHAAACFISSTRSSFKPRAAYAATTSRLPSLSSNSPRARDSCWCGRNRPNGHLHPSPSPAPAPAAAVVRHARTAPARAPALRRRLRSHTGPNDDPPQVRWRTTISISAAPGRARRRRGMESGSPTAVPAADHILKSTAILIHSLKLSLSDPVIGAHKHVNLSKP